MTFLLKNGRRTTIASLLFLGVAACGDKGGSGVIEPGPEPAPTSIEAVGGVSQTGTVGEALSQPITARVLDSNGNGVASESVQFTVTAGGGSLVSGETNSSSLTLETSSDGTVEAAWVLGTTSGEAQEVSASFVDSDGEVADTAYFVATAEAGAPSSFESHNNDAAIDVVAGSTSSDILSVRVHDQYGNPVSGVVVSWSVTEGSAAGSVDPPQVTTDDSGVASSSFIAGNTAQTVTVTGEVQGLGTATYTFNIVAENEAEAENIQALGETSRTAAPGASTGTMSVKVTDASGTALAGQQVQWGFITGSGTLASELTTTGSDGISENSAEIGTNAQRYVIAAWLTVSPEDSAKFEIQVEAGSPANISALSGNGQTGEVSDTLPSPYVIEITDAYGNKVSGAPVSWTPRQGSVAEAEQTTDAAGRAQAYHILGSTSGEHSVDVSTSAIASTTVTFTSTATTDTTTTSTDTLSITTSSLPEGAVNSSYSQTVSASGGSGSYTWSITSGSLPPGLSSSVSGSDLLISGIPEAEGTYDFTVEVSSEDAQVDTQNYSVVIKTLTSADLGEIAFYSDRSGSFGIYVMNENGSNTINISTTQGAINMWPRWSPDGSRLMFMSSRESNRFDIFVMDANGSNQTNLTNSGVHDRHPDWGAGGDKIVFQSAGDIYMMNADGTDRTPVITDSVFHNYPDLNSDGTKLLFTSVRNGVEEVYLADLTTMDIVNLTPDAGSNTHPRWSPDETQIVFTSNREGAGQIYVMNADGSGVTRLTTNTAEDLYPSWSPDGSQILFTSTRDGNSEIYIMNSDGSNQTRITSNSGTDYASSWREKPPSQ